MHRFCSSEKAKKGQSRISEEKLTKMSDYFFLFRLFFADGRNIIMDLLMGIKGLSLKSLPETAEVKRFEPFLQATVTSLNLGIIGFDM